MDTKMDNPMHFYDHFFLNSDSDNLIATKMTTAGFSIDRSKVRRMRLNAQYHLDRINAEHSKSDNINYDRRVGHNIPIEFYLYYCKAYDLDPAMMLPPPKTGPANTVMRYHQFMDELTLLLRKYNKSNPNP